jgi:hypothetical protein
MTACPRCGGEPRIVSVRENDSFIAVCKKCRHHGVGATVKEAVDAFLKKTEAPSPPTAAAPIKPHGDAT